MKKQSAFSIMARLILLIRPLLGFMVLAVFLGVAGFICATFLTVLGAGALLAVAGFSAPATVTILLTIMAIFAAIRGFLRYGEQACNHYIAFKLLALIRDKVFAALRRLCPAKLEGRDKGNLIALITADIELLEVFYAHTISPAVIALIMSVLMSVFIGLFHPLLGALAAVAYFVVGVALPLYISRKSQGAGLAFRQKSGELSSFVLDNLRGLDEILQYHQGETRQKEMSRHTDSLLQTEEGMKRNTAKATAQTNTVVLLFNLAMLALGAWMHWQGSLSFEGVLISTIALMSSFGPVIALANLGSTLQNTLAAGSRVLALLDECPEVEEITGGIAVDFAGAGCEQIDFAYGNEPILKDFSLAISKGQVLGIVGKSGSGKSTLLRLLMRFWDVQSGTVQISNTDIRQINTANLRDMQGFVTQETHLFSDSIANNLRIAKPDATLQQLKDACRKASIHKFIASLPKGYETPVGELGDTLSGGERQRLGLARAFLHDAPFLLLDEPTSNLDSLNEAVILRSLQQECHNKTVVLVSHRASTMAVADRVISVEGGRLS